MGMQLIETVELASAASSIEFTSIPQDGVDLVLKFSLRASDTGGYSYIDLALNGSSSNFSSTFLRANVQQATPVTSGSQTYQIEAGTTGDGATASTFANGEITISNYASSAAKSYSADSVTENNSTTASLAITAGLWDNTSAITSLELSLTPYNFLQYSSASLYKITAD